MLIPAAVGATTATSRYAIDLFIDYALENMAPILASDIPVGAGSIAANIYSMRRELLSGPCLLCEAPSIYYEFDGGKRRHYRCSGSECGEYIVTDTVRRRIGVPSWRLQAAALAKRLSHEHQIVELWVNPETRVLETHLVPMSMGHPRPLAA